MSKTMLFIAMYFVAFVIAGILPLSGGVDMLNLSIKYASWQGFLIGVIMLIFGISMASIYIMKFWMLLRPPLKRE